MLKNTSIRRRPLLLVLALSFAASLPATPGYAQNTAAPVRKSYAIAAGSLEDVLTRFTSAAGIALSFDPALVAGLRSPGLNGSHDGEKGLRKLLEGSGLEALARGDGSYTLRQQPPATSGEALLAPVTVTAAAVQDTLPATYAGGQVARGGRVGVLGNKSSMDTPFSVTQYTSTLIEDQQAQNIGDVLINDASVRNTYSRGYGRDEFNIRGFTLFNYDVSYNGLYGVSPRNVSSLIGVERVEILRGPNALLNGMAPYGSVGGAINLVPKRAGAAPLNRVTMSYTDDSQIGSHIDIGRRFGAEQQAGVRFNAIHQSGDTPVDKAREKLDAVALGLDYQGERFRLETDINYQDRLTHARSGLLFPPSSGTQIGAAPDAGKNFLPSWTFWRATELSGVVRGELDLTPDLTAFVGLGAMQYDFRSLQTSWLMLDDQGSIAAQPSRLNEYVDTFTGEAGVRSKFKSGSLSHEAVVSASRFGLEQGSLRIRSSIVRSNLYAPADLTQPDIIIGNTIPKVSESNLNSLAVADTISTAGKKIQLTLGARHQQVETTSFDGTTGNQTSRYDKSALTPAIALTVRPTDTLAFYGNYIEGLGQGPTAPSSAINAGEIFAPSVSRQAELGMKHDAGRFATTLSVFQINQPSSFLDPASLRFGTDGRQRNRGIELMTHGEIARGVRLLAGTAFTKGKLMKTQGGSNDGKTAPATPHFQLNLAAEWDASFLPGLTLTARSVHTSSQYVDVANTQKIPSWTRYDLGARYAFVTGKYPVTLRASIENIFDKNYWQSAAREGLTVGAPRTLLLSVSADF